MELPAGWIEERIAHYKAERDRALDTVKRIDEGGWQFFEAQGQEEMRDVTAERRADQVRVADMLDNIVKLYERENAKGS